MHRSLFLAAALAVSSTALPIFIPGTARACGGFFCNAPVNPWDPPPVTQTAENVVFSVDRDAATGKATMEAHVQIFYAGPADKFSWVVPVLALPTLGVGINTLFQTLDPATRPSFDVRWHEFGTCKEPESGPFRGTRDAGASDGSGSGAGGSGGGSGGVDVAYRGDVGPYDAAVIKSDDPAALKTWLGDNGYFLSDTAGAIIDTYVAEKNFFVALKLISGKDVTEIQPIVLKFDGDSPCVPLRLTAIASINDLRVNLWILGEQRAVPQNYFELEVNQAKIDWFNQGRNYDSLLGQAANEAGGNAFAAEYVGSADVMSRRLWFEGRLDLAPLRQAKTPPDYLDALRVQPFPRDGQLLSLLRKHIPLPDSLRAMGVSETSFYNLIRSYWLSNQSDFKPFDPAALTDDIDVGIVQPLRAAQALFDRHSKLTRLATFISPIEMTKDPMFIFNGDLPDLSNVHLADANRLCGFRQYTVCTAPVQLVLPDGRQIRFLPRPSPGDPWCSPFYDRGKLDQMPAMQVAWRRDDVGQGDRVLDNEAPITEALAAHNLLNNSPRGELLTGGCDSCSIADAGGAGGVAAFFVLAALTASVRRGRRRP